MTTTATAGRGKKASAKRQRILDAAAKIFRQEGYTGARLTDIAAEAGTQAGSLYYHFASREDLVRAVLVVGQQRTIDFVSGRVDSLAASATSMDRLRAAITAHLEAVLEAGDYTAATLRILGQVPDEIRRETVALQRRYGNYWHLLFEAAEMDGLIRSDLDITSCRMLLIGSLNSTPDWFHTDKPARLSVTALEEHVVAVFLDGLATAKGRRRRSTDLAVQLQPGGTESDPAQTRGAMTSTRILDAAALLFRQNGYAGTRLVDVATIAELQTGSLYYHFASREDLVTQLLGDAWQRTDDAVRESLAALPARTAPINRLAVALSAYLMSVLSGGDYTSAMLRILGQVPDEVRNTIVPLQRKYLNLWRDLLRKAAAAKDIRDDLDLSLVVLLLTGAVNWSVEWYSPDRNIAPDNLAKQLSAVVFDGMATGRQLGGAREAEK